MRIAYIAGAYNAPDPVTHRQNIEAAERAAFQVALEDGWFPICVHATARHWFGFVSEAVAIAGDLEILRRCDAIVLSDRWLRSKWTRAEIAEAKRLGIPVFEDAWQLTAHFDDPWPHDSLISRWDDLNDPERMPF